MPDIDLTSDKPLEGGFSFEGLVASARATVTSIDKGKKDRRGAARPVGTTHASPGASATDPERIAYRQTFVKLRYVLLVDQTTCICGQSFLNPQGIYEESRSSKGGATNLAQVTSMPDVTLPRVIRTTRHSCRICPDCATSNHSFTDENSTEHS